MIWCSYGSCLIPGNLISGVTLHYLFQLLGKKYLLNTSVSTSKKQTIHHCVELQDTDTPNRPFPNQFNTIQIISKLAKVVFLFMLSNSQQIHHLITGWFIHKSSDCLDLKKMPLSPSSRESGTCQFLSIFQELYVANYNIHIYLVLKHLVHFTDTSWKRLWSAWISYR